MKKISLNMDKIVTLLNTSQFYDGNSIGNQLAITRTAVWKTIKKLQTYGIKIESIKGKGYALIEPLILLNKQKIKSNLKIKNIDLDIFETINSTNDYLKKFYSNKKIKVCMAEYQTQGKGRLNRKWHAPFAQNIYLSVLYPFEKDMVELAGLSLVVGLSLCKTLDNCNLPKPIAIKWPNDIIYENKKLAGILIEIQAETHGFCIANIGIGLNVNMSVDPRHQISQPWTSLQQISQQYIDRNSLVASIINNLYEYLQNFEKSGFTNFMSEWETRDSLYNKHIHLKTGNTQLEGKARGISQQGHLLLKQANGKIIFVSAGDASIVKK